MATLASTHACSRSSGFHPDPDPNPNPNPNPNPSPSPEPHPELIQLWEGERCVQSYTGHEDVVRDLALLPGVGFLSASNDGSVRAWEPC